jgi:hypothetical protein
MSLVMSPSRFESALVPGQHAVRAVGIQPSFPILLRDATRFSFLLAGEPICSFLLAGHVSPVPWSERAIVAMQPAHQEFDVLHALACH